VQGAHAAKSDMLVTIALEATHRLRSDGRIRPLDRNWLASSPHVTRVGGAAIIGASLLLTLSCSGSATAPSDRSTQTITATLGPSSDIPFPMGYHPITLTTAGTITVTVLSLTPTPAVSEWLEVWIGVPDSSLGLQVPGTRPVCFDDKHVVVELVSPSVNPSPAGCPFRCVSTSALPVQLERSSTVPGSFCVGAASISRSAATYTLAIESRP